MQTGVWWIEAATALVAVFNGVSFPADAGTYAKKRYKVPTLKVALRNGPPLSWGRGFLYNHPGTKLRELPRERVVLQHQGAAALLQNVGVDLGRADVGMAEQGLKGPQIGTVGQQMGGEGVAQHVG